jgi:hypothetical protein
VLVHRKALVLTAMLAALAAAAVLPAQASAEKFLAFHGKGENADYADLDMFAPEGLNQITVVDQECGDGHLGYAEAYLSDGKRIRRHIITPGDCKSGRGFVPRGQIVVSFRMCEPGMPPRLRCGPSVLGPRDQGQRR